MDRITQAIALFAILSAPCAADQPLLEALKYAVEHISEADWKRGLEKAGVEPADNNILDRLLNRASVHKDISLPGLLSICEEVARDLPENGDFNKACFQAVSEQLHEKSQAQLILDWIWAANSPSSVASFNTAEIFVANTEPNIKTEVPDETDSSSPTIVSAHRPPFAHIVSPESSAEPSKTTTTLTGSANSGHDLIAAIPPGASLSEMVEGLPTLDSSDTTLALVTSQKDDSIPHVLTANSLASPFNGSTSLNPNACLNVSYIPYMDWIYYASLPSVFKPPFCRSFAEEDFRCFTKGFVSVQPHYTYAKVKLENSHAQQMAPGIFVEGGTIFPNHWVLSAMLDYGRSFNHWNPSSSGTKDTTNRLSLSPSLTYLFKNAYIQAMLLGIYNQSKITNSFITHPFSLNHWGFGARLDGSLHFDLSSNRLQWGLEPYLSFDYFSAFQSNIDSMQAIYVKKARFFQLKGLFQLYAQFYPTSALCLIPRAYTGFSLANAFSRTLHSASCDTLPSYPNWQAASLGGEVSFLYGPRFLAKAQIDINLCRSVQIYSTNFSIGWKW
jgi:hypothetical protein